MESMDTTYLALYLKALGNTTRLRIVEELAEGEKCVSDVESSLGISQATVSQHLAVLKEHGIVACRKDGPLRCYCLSDPELTVGILELAKKGMKKEMK